MIAGLIFVISIPILLKFFVSYSRSLIVESRGHELSEQVRGICGIETRVLAGDQFGRLLQLVTLCPQPGGNAFEVRAIAVYFRLLDLARILLGWAVPSAGRWIEAERGGCAYVAAVVLDRRIAYNRTIMAQLASH
jgi:hypothetical protein